MLTRKASSEPSCLVRPAGRAIAKTWPYPVGGRECSFGEPGAPPQPGSVHGAERPTFKGSTSAQCGA